MKKLYHWLLNWFHRKNEKQLLIECLRVLGQMGHERDKPGVMVITMEASERRDLIVKICDVLWPGWMEKMRRGW